MAFTMRGLPQYGDEGPKQLGNFARRIFGNKEQREREKKYFKAKKEIRKGYETTNSCSRSSKEGRKRKGKIE